MEEEGEEKEDVDTIPWDAEVSAEDDWLPWVPEEFALEEVVIEEERVVEVVEEDTTVEEGGGGCRKARMGPRVESTARRMATRFSGIR